MKKADKIIIYIAIVCVLVCVGIIMGLLALGWPKPGKFLDCVLGILLLSGGLLFLFIGVIIGDFWNKRFAHQADPVNLIGDPGAFFWSQVPNALSTVGSLVALCGLGLIGYAAYCFIAGK